MMCNVCIRSVLHKHRILSLIAGILIILFLLANVITIPLIQNQNVVTNTYLITDKEFVGRSNYLIFVKNEYGKPFVFENTDSPYRGKYISDELNAILEIGKEYNLTTVGYEIPVLSKYPNIIGVEPPE